VLGDSNPDVPLRGTERMSWASRRSATQVYHGVVVYFVDINRRAGSHRR
jgi:hypothetical protein